MSAACYLVCHVSCLNLQYMPRRGRISMWPASSRMHSIFSFATILKFLDLYVAPLISVDVSSDTSKGGRGRARPAKRRGGAGGGRGDDAPRRQRVSLRIGTGKKGRQAQRSRTRGSLRKRDRTAQKVAKEEAAMERRTVSLPE
mmetsp:Transcript_36526/g.74377  ORF Transcript_36526/g.74377 Transcript_36526/m.74377 type:complete len:143 (+) Transcript_36526:282-710(+)